MANSAPAAPGVTSTSRRPHAITASGDGLTQHGVAEMVAVAEQQIVESSVGEPSRPRSTKPTIGDRALGQVVRDRVVPELFGRLDLDRHPCGSAPPEHRRRERWHDRATMSTPSAHQFVDIRTEGRVAVVTMNRADRLNALGPQLVGGLIDAFRHLHRATRGRARSSSKARARASAPAPTSSATVGRHPTPRDEGPWASCTAPRSSSWT